MDKKIYSIGMVKNEADIIESYVRYNLNILDGMIILDNGSTDNTVHILKQLKNEGLPIFFFEDTGREYLQSVKMNQLLEKAIYEFHADVVIPLDADEFIIASHQGNPRKILENIQSDTYFLVKWKTFVPTFPEKENSKFIPAYITTVRDDSLEEFYKVILPKELVKDYNVKLKFGNHDLEYASNLDSNIKRFINYNLRIAHFPIRSKEQTISKIVVGWIYSISLAERSEGQSFHWKLIFDKLKENKNIDNHDVTEFAKTFALTEEKIEVKLKEEPIDLTFCKDLEIRYTKKVQPISNILNSMEWLAMDYANFKKDTITREKALIKQIEDLSMAWDEFSRDKLAVEERLRKKIEDYEKSTSWTITAPLRKIVNFLRKL